MSEDITAGRLLIIEYESLKREQAARIGTRDNLVYAALAAMGLMIAAGLKVGTDARMLLLLPPVAVVLGWTRIANDVKVTHIGQYVRGELAARLGAVAGEPVFDWERAHGADGHRVLRKVCQAVADLVLFAAAPLAALVVFWLTGYGNAGLIVVSIVEALLVAGLGAVIIAYSGIVDWSSETVLDGS